MQQISRDSDNVNDSLSKTESAQPHMATARNHASAISINRWLAAVVVLQAMILIGQWLAPSLPMAHAQIPDSGAQLQVIIEQSKATNARLDKIISILEDGKLQVHVAKSDEDKAR